MSHHPLHPQLASQARRSILPLAALSLICIMPQAHAGKVLSGSLNTASGRDAVVVSGGENTASGGNSVVVGGVRNTASGPKSIVVAGRGNKAEGANASILSGLGNTAGGSGSSVLTGNVNNSSGEYSSILSGINNIVRVGALRSAVLSGSENVIEDTAINSYIGGGTKNSNAGNRSAILGGSKNIIQANGFNTVVAGVLASSNHANSFVFNSDGTNALGTTDDGQFLVNATGGVILNGGTTIQGPLTVSGGLSYEGGDGSIIAVVGPAGQDGEQGSAGQDGTDGINGTDGTNGTNGSDGSDGVGVSQTTIDADGNLIVTLTNGSEINAGQVGNSNSNLKLSENSVVFDYTGGTGSVDIQSDTNWIGDFPFDSWLTTATPFDEDGEFKGNGNQTFTFEVAELTGNMPRETNVRFESTSGPISGWNFTIRQEPNPIQQLGTDIDGEAQFDNSGRSVSLSSDGSTVAIGASWNDGNGAESGHVRIYQYDGSSWQQLGTDIDGEAAFNNSGWSVSLSADGSTVAIGATSNDAYGTGTVRIYQYINSSWQQLGTDIDGEARGNESGYSVSLSADGSTVAIGAPYNDGNGANSGHVRIYRYINSSWQQLGTDIDAEAESDNSGRSVSLSADGSTVAIGAAQNDGNGANSGHVRVYQYINSSWQQLGTDIDGEAEYDFSGNSVSLSADGSTVAIGAPYNDSNGIDSGHVRIYRYINSSWQQLGTDIDGEAQYDNSGWSVSLSDDGSTVAIGAPTSDGNGFNSGHVRVYEYDGSSWVQLGTDIDGEAEYDQSGYSVSLSADGSTVAIGAIYNGGNGDGSGHVRIFKVKP